jgi:hypothetical protein
LSLSAEQPGGVLCVLRYLLHHNRRPNVLKLSEGLWVVVLGDELYTVSDTSSLIHIDSPVWDPTNLHSVLKHWVVCYGGVNTEVRRENHPAALQKETNRDVILIKLGHFDLFHCHVYFQCSVVILLSLKDVDIQK